jgi:hypothetical protein
MHEEMRKFFYAAVGVLVAYWVIIPLIQLAVPERWRPSWWTFRPYADNLLIGLIAFGLVMLFGFVWRVLTG